MGLCPRGARVTPHNKPILRNRWVSRRWAQRGLASNWSCDASRRDLRERDLLYCDSAVPFSWLRDVPHRKAIYRIADHYSAFDKFSAALAESELDLAQWVDVVVYAAQTLEEHVKSLHPRNMAHLPNGVNFDHFFRKRDETAKRI